MVGGIRGGRHIGPKRATWTDGAEGPRRDDRQKTLSYTEAFWLGALKAESGMDQILARIIGTRDMHLVYGRGN